jgi:hypothetical protein
MTPIVKAPLLMSPTVTNQHTSTYLRLARHMRDDTRGEVVLWIRASPASLSRGSRSGLSDKHVSAVLAS